METHKKVCVWHFQYSPRVFSATIFIAITQHFHIFYFFVVRILALQEKKHVIFLMWWFVFILKVTRIYWITVYNVNVSWDPVWGCFIHVIAITFCTYCYLYEDHCDVTCLQFYCLAYIYQSLELNLVDFQWGLDTNFCWIINRSLLP